MSENPYALLTSPATPPSPQNMLVPIVFLFSVISGYIKMREHNVISLSHLATVCFGNGVFCHS